MCYWPRFYALWILVQLLNSLASLKNLLVAGILLYCFYNLICVFERQRNKKTDTGKKSSHLLAHFPNTHKAWCYTEAEMGAWKTVSFPTPVTAARSIELSPLPSRVCISRKLNSGESKSSILEASIINARLNSHSVKCISFYGLWPKDVGILVPQLCCCKWVTLLWQKPLIVLEVEMW